MAMKSNVIIIDDFYSNPDEVRSFALSQDFDVTGNYPGSRTKSFINDSTKENIQKLINPHAGKVIGWNDVPGGTGCFQITVSKDRSWIHSDYYNTWAGIIYLTPNAPLSGGTGIFKHKESNSRYDEKNTYDDDSYDMTKWELVDRIGNVYNRLALYRSSLFHISLDYFGKDMNDGRLFQLFFLNTEF